MTRILLTPLRGLHPQWPSSTPRVCVGTNLRFQFNISRELRQKSERGLNLGLTSSTKIKFAIFYSWDYDHAHHANHKMSIRA